MISVALDLETGKVRSECYKSEDPIVESSPAVARGRCLVGDSWRDAARRSAQRTVAGSGRSRRMLEIKSSPVVVDAVVLTGSHDGHPARARQPPPAKQRWEFETDGPVHATPAVVNGVVYVAGCDENFRAISLADGKEILPCHGGSQHGGVAPVIDGDRAYVGTFNNEVLAIDLKAEKDRVAYENPDRQLPVSIRRRLLAGGRSSSAAATSWSTPSTRRPARRPGRSPPARVVDSSPVVAGNRVYIGSSDGRLYVLDPASGTKVWSSTRARHSPASPAVARRQGRSRIE